MEEIAFRSAEPEDWREIKSLLQEADLPLLGAEEHLEDFVLAHRAKETLGCGGWERYGEFALLRSVVVKAPERGKGVGLALLQHLLWKAQREHITHLYLLTTTAPEFFHRLGFRAITRQDVPCTVQTSVEFQEACPQSAIVMEIAL